MNSAQLLDEIRGSVAAALGIDPDTYDPAALPLLPGPVTEEDRQAARAEDRADSKRTNP